MIDNRAATLLSNAIKLAESLASIDYTTASFAVMQAALSDAKACAPDATIAVMQDLTTKLNNAVTALVNIKSLKAAITAAQALKQADYIPISWSALQVALTQAITCPNNATQADVDTFTTSLNNEIASLIKVPNKKLLNDAIKAAQALKQADYTSTSWKAMQTALSAANACSENALQADVDNLTSNLNDAVIKLVNISGLKAAIAKAQSLKKSDYTPDSWRAVKTTLNAALVCVDNASQKEIDTLTSNLNKSISALQYKPHKSSFLEMLKELLEQILRLRFN